MNWTPYLSEDEPKSIGSSFFNSSTERAPYYSFDEDDEATTEKDEDHFWRKKTNTEPKSALYF